MQARADYLQRLGEEAVREDNMLRKRRSRRQQAAEGVTDQTTKDQSQKVGKEDDNSSSQAATATTERDSRRVPDETDNRPPSTINGSGVIEPAGDWTEQREPATATTGSAQPVHTAEQNLQQKAPAGWTGARCSCCGAQGWLVPWVLFAKAQQRSLRRLLASDGP